MAAQIIAFPQQRIARVAPRDFGRFEEALTVITKQNPDFSEGERIAEALRVERIAKLMEESWARLHGCADRARGTSVRKRRGKATGDKPQT